MSPKHGFFPVNHANYSLRFDNCVQNDRRMPPDSSGVDRPTAMSKGRGTRQRCRDLKNCRANVDDEVQNGSKPKTDKIVQRMDQKLRFDRIFDRFSLQSLLDYLKATDFLFSRS